MTLCLPRSSTAAVAAVRPRGLPAASIRYHLRSISPVLARVVLMGVPPKRMFQCRRSRKARQIVSMVCPGTPGRMLDYTTRGRQSQYLFSNFLIYILQSLIFSLILLFSPVFSKGIFHFGAAVLSKMAWRRKNRPGRRLLGGQRTKFFTSFLCILLFSQGHKWYNTYL